MGQILLVLLLASVAAPGLGLWIPSSETKLASNAETKQRRTSVTVYLDFSDEPALADFAFKSKREIEAWYGRIHDEWLSSPGYTPPSEIYLKFDKNYDGVAYASGNNIVGSTRYYLNNQHDVGSMIHEAVHVIQQSRQYDDQTWWLVEGIADYIRYYKYEPNNAPNKPPPSASYNNGYGTTAYLLNFIQTRVGDMVYWCNKDLREGTYNDEIWPRLTGKTIQQHWDDMQREG